MMTPLQQHFYRLRQQKTDPLLASGLVERDQNNYPVVLEEDVVLGAMGTIIDENRLDREDLQQIYPIEAALETQPLILYTIENSGFMELSDQPTDQQPSQVTASLSAAEPSVEEPAPPALQRSRELQPDTAANTLEITYLEAQPPTHIQVQPQLTEAESPTIDLALAAIEEEVWKLLRQGDEYLVQDQIEAAIDCYQQAVSLAPDLVEAHQYLAEALTQQGDLQAAARHYSRALELTPLPALTEDNAIQTTAAPDIDQLPWYEQGAFYLQQGEVYCAHEQWADVITNCRKAIDCLGSQSATAYRLLGRALQAEHQPEEAQQAYQTALALQPNLPETHARLASLLTEQEQLQEAVQYYQQAIALDPNFAGAYLKLGDVWQKLGDASQAADCWYEAVRLQPTWASAEEHLRLGMRLASQRKLPQAIDCYQRVLQLEPGFAEAYYQLAIALGQQGEWQQAQIASEQAVNSDPFAIPYQVGLGQALTELASWQTAIEVYQKVLTLPLEKDRIPEILQRIEYCQRALVAESYEKMAADFVQQQQWQEAITCYRLAVERHPQNAQAQAGLARSLAATQQWQEALVCCQTAVQLDEKNAEYSKLLASILLQLGKFEEAARYYRQLVEPSQAAPTQSPKASAPAEPIAEQSVPQVSIAPIQIPAARPSSKQPPLEPSSAAPAIATVLSQYSIF